MAGQVNIAGLSWDIAIPEVLSGTQRWVLSAMQKHGPELVTMLWRILGNEQDVCDAYQDTFLKLAHYEAGQKPQYVRAYVFRTAANTALSMLRHKIIERNRVRTLQMQSPTNTNGDLNTVWLRDRLRCCIAKLPRNLREVVTLHDLAELPYGQVGRILDITAATARVYRCKAIRLLAAWMSKSEDEI
jgi:RNA polymerase sigma factor (sigma-70 family)